MKNLLIALVLFAIAQVASPLKSQEEEGVKFGREYKGVIKSDDPSFSHYSTKIPIKLNEGQSVTISATVVGENRVVGIMLIDPDLKPIVQTKGELSKSARLKCGEVPITGTYTIKVHSNLKGGFTLLVNDPALAANPEAAIKALEARIEQLERELAEAKAKLYKLRKKELDSPIEKK